MKIYSKPWYYTASHIAIGFFAAWIPLVGVLALVYQLGQLAFNVRVFPVEWALRPGNSVEHTALKLAEVGVGYLLGQAVKQSLWNSQEQ